MESNHFKFIKFIMVFTGTWRMKLQSSSKFRQTFYNIYSFCVQSYFCLFILSLFIQLPVVWKESKAKLFENLGVSIFCVIMVMKMVICQSKNITRLLSQLFEGEQAILASKKEKDKIIYYDQVTYTNQINFSVAFFTFFMVGMPLIILNYISYLQFEKTHMNSTTEEPKPLPYVSWFPFDQQENYFIAFGMDSVAVFMGSATNCITQLFFLSIITFMIGRLKILQQHFRNFDLLDEEDEQDATINHNEQIALQNLKIYILEHEEVIEFIEKLNYSMKYLMLLEFLMNSVQVASLLVQILTMEPNIIILFTVTYLGLIIYQIFLLAWHGNEIKEQSLELSMALYESMWYEHSIPVRKSIHLMMVRSQKELTLQIGPFYPMTMSTALSTMKAAYSYVTILRK